LFASVLQLFRGRLRLHFPCGFQANVCISPQVVGNGTTSCFLYTYPFILLFDYRYPQARMKNLSSLFPKEYRWRHHRK
jgi:hypothetical protein